MFNYIIDIIYVSAHFSLVCLVFNYNVKVISYDYGCLKALA